MTKEYHRTKILDNLFAQIDNLYDRMFPYEYGALYGFEMDKDPDGNEIISAITADVKATVLQGEDGAYFEVYSTSMGMIYQLDDAQIAAKGFIRLMFEYNLFTKSSGMLSIPASSSAPTSARIAENGVSLKGTTRTTPSP